MLDEGSTLNLLLTVPFYIFIWTGVNHLTHIQGLMTYCMHLAYSQRSRKGTGFFEQEIHVTCLFSLLEKHQ